MPALAHIFKVRLKFYVSDMTSATREAALVALTLSAVARLFIAFQHARSPAQQANFLQAAGDLLDKTVPFDDVKKGLQSAGANQVAYLVERRHRIAAVPPGLWRKDKASLNEMGAEHYSGYRAVVNILKAGPGQDVTQAWPRARAWLEPAWARYPALKEEAQKLEQL